MDHCSKKTRHFFRLIILDIFSGVFVDHAYVTKPDIPVLNGVIHVIDAVLVPN